MTEELEDGNYLVRVRAQVMTRDDSTGGWVPMGGGGLSNVSVRKRGLTSDLNIPEDIKHEYLIFGKRISDQSVVLSCIIKKDFEYNKVMPTFHHWRTGDKKFGLTFQTAADARAFDKGVRTAMEDLIEGPLEKNGPSLCKGITAETSQVYSSLSGIHGAPPTCKADVGDDDVFMTLNLPVERGDSRSSSDSSSGKPPLAAPVPAPAEPESYSYVQLTAVHDYMYPVVEGEGSLKKRVPLSLPNKRKERCRHCQEPFSSETNVRGSCPYAPDGVRAAIERVTCWGLAQRVLQAEPCECGVGCGRRWLALALLSLLVPCLWCYPPLRACHFCCVSCGLCGGKHRPAS